MCCCLRSRSAMNQKVVYPGDTWRFTSCGSNSDWSQQTRLLSCFRVRGEPDRFCMRRNRLCRQLRNLITVNPCADSPELCSFRDLVHCGLLDNLLSSSVLSQPLRSTPVCLLRHAMPHRPTTHPADVGRFSLAWSTAVGRPCFDRNWSLVCRVPNRRFLLYRPPTMPFSATIVLPCPIRLPIHQTLACELTNC